MKTEEFIEKIENIINENKAEQTKASEKQNGNREKNNLIMELLLLILSFVLDVLKSPFKLIATYVKNELFKAVKNDVMIYAVLLVMMGVLFVFFSVLWLSLSVAVSVYYYEHGKTMLHAIFYSLAFQGGFFAIISLIAWILKTKLNSLKVLRKQQKSISYFRGK